VKLSALELVPLDVVSVRDGRPFDAGTGHLARGLWPPSPWTVLGALRTLLLEAHGVDPRAYGEGDEEAVGRARDVAGEPDGPPPFALGPAILHGTRTGKPPAAFLPTPLDLHVAKDDGVLRLTACRAEELHSKAYAASDIVASSVLFAPVHLDEEKRPKYLDSAGLRAYLQGKRVALPSKNECGESSPVVEETRIGIGMEGTTVREGLFYVRRGFGLRQGFTLRVALSANAPEPLRELRGTIGLGGDGHLVRVGPADVDLPDAESSPGGATLYFASPVRPDDLGAEWLSELCGGSVRIRAIATARSLALGGWRLARACRGPRPMRRYQPAGTVLYVEGNEGCDFRRLHARSLANDPEERAAGFGYCLIGRMP
jgi:CRISPR-associated protein Cmr3